MISSRPIRSVVFLTYHFPPEVGGIQTRISKYVEKLGTRGIRVTVIVAGRKPFRASVIGENVVVCTGGLSLLPKNSAAVAGAIIRARADVMHVFTGASTILALSALLMATSLRVSTVISVFGREDLDLPSFFQRMVFRVSGSLARVVDVNSSATATLLPEKFRGKSYVLLGGADEPDTLPAYDLMEPPSFLFVGRLTARKGVDDLLKAFAIVKSRYREARLSVVGDGPEREGLVSLASSLGLADSVRFTGSLWGEELRHEYARCCALVLPSKNVPTDSANEGLGLTLIEASMHGKPLIGTRHGGIPEVVRDGENGLLVPPSDPAALSQALLKIIENKPLARMMGETGYRLAKSTLTWERATDRLLESYKSVRSSARPKQR